MGMHDTMNKHTVQDDNCMDKHNKKYMLFYQGSSVYDELDWQFSLKQTKSSADLMYDEVNQFSILLFAMMAW